MKTPLGTEVDIGASHIVLDGFPELRERGPAPPPSFRPMSIVATVAHLSYTAELLYKRSPKKHWHRHDVAATATESHATIFGDWLRGVD